MMETMKMKMKIMTTTMMTMTMTIEVNNLVVKYFLLNSMWFENTLETAFIWAHAFQNCITNTVLDKIILLRYTLNSPYHSTLETISVCVSVFVIVCTGSVIFILFLCRAHASTRVLIEQVNGQLKNKFRCLLGQGMQLIPEKTVMSSLHAVSCSTSARYWESLI